MELPGSGSRFPNSPLSVCSLAAFSHGRLCYRFPLMLSVSHSFRKGKIASKANPTSLPLSFHSAQHSTGLVYKVTNNIYPLYVRWINIYPLVAWAFSILLLFLFFFALFLHCRCCSTVGIFNCAFSHAARPHGRCTLIDWKSRISNGGNRHHAMAILPYRKRAKQTSSWTPQGSWANLGLSPGQLNTTLKLLGVSFGG